MRKGTSLIELIFAIVVIGIAILSIPTILNMVSQTSTLINQKKEIYTTSSNLTNTLHNNWNTTNGIYATTDEKWGKSPLYFNNVFQKNTNSQTDIKLINISTPSISMSAFTTKPTLVELNSILLP